MKKLAIGLVINSFRLRPPAPNTPRWRAVYPGFRDFRALVLRIKINLECVRPGRSVHYARPCVATCAQMQLESIRQGL